MHWHTDAELMRRRGAQDELYVAVVGLQSASGYSEGMPVPTSW